MARKNKKLVAALEKQGHMMLYGMDKIAQAKETKQWDVLQSQVMEEAHENFQNMSPSVQRTHARAHCNAKTDAGRKKRLAWMADRLNRN